MYACAFMNNYVYLYIDYLGMHVLEERLCTALQGSHIYISIKAQFRMVLLEHWCLQFMNNYVCLYIYEDL